MKAKRSLPPTAWTRSGAAVRRCLRSRAIPISIKDLFDEAGVVTLGGLAGA